ncbi:MAG: branched-chain amino acid ABC transporter permease [Candidatus Rokuibacteriota bacterium]|nr:MAG: branched-chain amino acid ABC transporter permease [Candidatus Rokubacteria bacterium]
MNRTLSWRSALVFAALAALPLTPWMSKYYMLLAFDALLFGAVAMSLDLLMGYAGLVSFGHAAFFGLGAYATAVLLERGVLSLWLCLGLAAVVVGAYALIVSYFATSRRGIYFALLTLIFAEVIYTFFRYTQTFGGSDGIQGLPPPRVMPGVAVDTPARIYYLALVYLLLAYLACRVLVGSHFGRVLVAIRENEDRARFLGYDVQRYKMGVCLISALLTGLAGALYPGRAAYATPDLLHWSVSGEFIIMVMIGGLGTLVGPILGGAFFIVLQEKVSSYVEWYSIIVGLVLVLIVLFAPRGLLGFRQALRGRPAAKASR